VSPVGLPAERTRLSWRRTTLAATITALLAIRVALADPARAPLIGLVVLGWLATLWLAHGRITTLGRDPEAAIGRSPAALALLTVGYSALGIVLVLL
jgi:hypothetical protein